MSYNRFIKNITIAFFIKYKTKRMRTSVLINRSKRNVNSQKIIRQNANSSNSIFSS